MAMQPMRKTLGWTMLASKLSDSAAQRVTHTIQGMKGESGSAAIRIIAVNALEIYQLNTTQTKPRYSQQGSRDLRFERHEDDSINHHPSVIRSFSSSVEPIEDGSSEDQMGNGTNGRPEDHHHLECLFYQRGTLPGRELSPQAWYR